MLVDPAELLERLGIKYERRGDTLWASCPTPTHNDSSPSWRIIADEDDAKYGMSRCYGCGFFGGPVRLVEAVLGCSREDAREWLKDIKQNPPLPLSVSVELNAGLSPTFRLPQGVCEWCALESWPLAVRNYARKRGLLDWQIQRWGIVYAPTGFDAVRNRLAGRIVFPVRNLKGKLIGYTGRTYTDHKTRYVEPKKSEGADLGAVFGEQHWPKTRRRVVAVAEGALDALAIERAYPYSLAVAGIYGSQLHQGHIARLSTFEHVLMCTDPDKAGNTVASQLTEELRRWVQVFRVQIPEGEDCASMTTADLKSAVESALRGIRNDRNRSSLENGQKRSRPRTQVSLVRSRR